MSKLIVFILFINVAFFKVALANCNYNLDVPVINQTITTTNINQSYTFSLRNQTDLTNINCWVYYYYFSKGNSSSYTRKATNGFGESLNYNIYKFSNQTGTLKDKNDAYGNNDYIRGFLYRRHQVSNKSIYFYLPSSSGSSMVRGGVYTDNITVNVYSIGSIGDWGHFEFSRNMPVVINVPKVINISLVDTGAPFDIGSTNKTLNFGNLETGEEMKFDLRVATNAGFRVMLSSLNNGKLGNSLNGQKLDYSLSISGNLINLSNSANNPVTVATGSGVTGQEGALFPVKVKIGNINENKSGDYEDYITITAITNE